MKLIDLEPEFERWFKGIADEHLGQTLPDGTIQWGGFETDYIAHPDNLAEAQGLCFLCPKCFLEAEKVRAAGGRMGVHSVEISFAGRGLQDDQGMRNKDGPVRWQVSGTGFDDLTVTPSILVLTGCGYHGFITNGEVSII